MTEGKGSAANKGTAPRYCGSTGDGVFSDLIMGSLNTELERVGGAALMG